MSSVHSSMTTIPYGPDPDQVGDLHLPDVARTGLPLIVVVHGGFWRSYWRRDLMTPLATDLASAGAAVWNVEYRRVGSGGGVPHTLRDVAQAVDVLDDVGARLGIDTGRVAVVGHSAGGHLAGWLAQRARYGADGVHPVRVRPSAVVALAPVLDLVEAERRVLGGHAAAEFVGARLDEDPGAFERVSPAHHLPLGVPMAIVHGTADDRVPHDLSVAYTEAARAVGDPVELITVGGADHFAVIDPTHDAWRAARTWLGI